MIKASNIDVKCDSSLLSISPLVVKNVKDRGEDGSIVDTKELQFQINPLKGFNLSGLEAEVNYYDKQGKFIGADSDLRLDILKDSEKHTFSLFIDEPESTYKAELVINSRKYGVKEKITHILYPLGIVSLFGYIIYNEFIK